MATAIQDFDQDKKDIEIYTYDKSLPENKFRLIELISLEPEIEIRLVEVDYGASEEENEEEKKEYFAVSYCWGTEADTERIVIVDEREGSGVCHRRFLDVTPHLKEGLRCLYTVLVGAEGQSWSRSQSPRLWIDAICINQADKKEKAVQVKKMYLIYHGAKEVYVWLGPEAEESAAVISAIRDASRVEEADADLQTRLLNLKSEAPRLFDVAMFKPLAALSRRAWFRRLWTVQEYVLGEKVRFFCGMSTISDEVLTGVLRRLSIYSFGGDEPPGFREELELFRGFSALTALANIRNSHLNERKMMSFFDLVMLGRERLVKEPVDRIYAAFGMAEGSDGVYRDEIAVNYSEEGKREYWRVYTAFGKIALVHEPHLRLLSVVSSSVRPDLLPS